MLQLLMTQHLFITHTRQLKHVADAMADRVFCNAVIPVDSINLSAEDMQKMAKHCMTEYFYVINSDTELVFDHFNFSFKPPEWDSDLVHIWGTDARVKLYNKNAVLADPTKYTDEQMLKGNIAIKSMPDKIYSYPQHDIIFISFDEESADKNYALLTARFPRAKRVHGVYGIFEAHKAAAHLARSNLFYVVDADAIIDPAFNFDYMVDGYNSNSVHVWHSLNPVNDLTYGYGAVKLFPTKLLKNYNGSPVDFTTSVSKNFKVIPKVSNITKFNTDPFSAWRSGFRECAKLASKLIVNGNNTESAARLSDWCTLGTDKEFGEFTILGANAGANFGRMYINQPEQLRLINNYEWLEYKFNELTI